MMSHSVGIHAFIGDTFGGDPFLGDAFSGDTMSDTYIQWGIHSVGIHTFSGDAFCGDTFGGDTYVHLVGMHSVVILCTFYVLWHRIP